MRSDQCCRSGVFNKRGRSERGEPMANSEPTFENVSKGPLLWGLPAHLSRERINLVQGLLVFFAGGSGRRPSFGPLALPSGARISFRHGAILTPVRVHYKAHTWPCWTGSEALVAGLSLTALSAVYLQRGSAPLRFHTLKFLFLIDLGDQRSRTDARSVPQYGRWQSFGATAKQFIVSTGGGEPGETAGFCIGGGGGKGLEAALGAGPALAVCVLETDLWPPTY